MSSKARGMEEFLKKRGYETTISEVVPGSYNVIVNNSLAHEVVTLLGQIADGNRFFVTVSHEDFLEVINNSFEIESNFNALSERIESGVSSANSNIQTKYDYLMAQIRERHELLSNRIDELIFAFDKDISENRSQINTSKDELTGMIDPLINKKSWIKRLFRRK